MVVKCTFRDRIQWLACTDICQPAAALLLERLLHERRCDLVYSDPPWNPGNEKYWRQHAGVAEGNGYAHFLASWCSLVALCVERGAQHVLCEQSANDAHKQMLLSQMQQRHFPLPLLEEWAVFYGSPGSISCRRPNVLLHFGNTRLTTDPSTMAGEPMTIRACTGLLLSPGSLIVDPCIGKGMTSRMAHYFDWDCLGLELNHARLDKAINWLKKQGYACEQID